MLLGGFLLALGRAVKLHAVIAEMLRNGMFCAVLRHQFKCLNTLQMS